MSEDVFSTIDHKAFYDKSARHIEAAFKRKSEGDIDGYILSAALSLEHLAKATLSKISPFLIIRHNCPESLLIASQQKSKINNKGKEVPIQASEIKTIGAAEAYRKIAVIISGFSINNEKICQSVAQVRNTEAHSGAPISKSLESHWEGSYLDACSVILDCYGSDLSQWNEQAEREYTSIIIQATIKRHEETIKKVEDAVNRARVERKRISHTEIKRRSEKSRDFKFSEEHPEYWKLKCPICSELAHVAGNETFSSIMDYLIAHEKGNYTHSREKEFFPSRFHCAVCKLRLNSEEEVRATNFFGTRIIRDNIPQ